MANKAKSTERDRRARIEAMRAAEKARERRKSLLFVVVAAVVGLGLVAGAAVPAFISSRNDPANAPLANFGVRAAAADCGEVESEPAAGNNDHREAGLPIEYESFPPSSGPHWPAPVIPARAFYTERDRPEVEQLVHNLEHGYTVVWYDETVEGDELDALEDIAASAREKAPTGPTGKFIVAPWDPDRGDLPEGKHIAMTHWGAEEGHRQLCGSVSGQAVADFIEAYPASDAPEPNAA